jgi:hypothetical protein
MDILDVITDYFGVGGLFNPELMEHDKVSNMVEMARAEITSLREHLEIAKKDGDKWRYLVDNKANIVTVENEKRGYRSTMPNAVRERWYEFEGYMISTSTTNETFKTYDEAIDNAMKVME